MTAPTTATWPYRTALIRAALALLLAIVSMMFDNWAGMALMIAAILVGILAAVDLFRAWGNRAGR